MEALICFVVATFVFLLLFDHYCHEESQQERTPATVRDVVDDGTMPAAKSRYYSTSLFAILGLSREEVHDFAAFRDRFSTFSEVSTAMRRAGLPDIHVIVGIDFSASNEWQGRRTFRGESLHTLKPGTQNPYQRALASLGAAVGPLLHGNPIPAFGFGDLVTKDVDIFPLIESGASCLDFNDLMCAYTHAAHKVAPLSLVVVVLGDGPCGALVRWDDGVPERRFDNLQVVRHAEVTRGCRHPDAALALHALMEVPDQYRAAVQLGLLKGGMSP
ncbi:uncharacterized protein [Dermacentor albipictus]|uniref:uncharacterized protein isoform X2 n=1 Tax=Dermacentor albipictus TaxID=60249 RepID=UPI0038FC2280